jgi:hypothetical protein
MPAIPEMGAVWSASDQALTAISTGADADESYTTAVQQIVDAIGLMNSTERIVVLVGSLQAAANPECADWAPDCRGTELTDEDGDGVYTGSFDLPAGEYEYKIAVNLSWAENYGEGGVKDGGNLKLSLAADSNVTFSYNDSTHEITATTN